MSNAKTVQKYIRKCANKKKAVILSGFFKTGKGEYGEGDKFLGVTVPQIRSVARKHSDLDFKEIEKLLTSQYHEERLLALLMLVQQFNGGSAAEQKKIYTYYLRQTRFINNWDLVDLSADKIVGAYLTGKSRDVLYRLAKSKNIWERRIAIIATYQFIRKNDFSDTLGIASILLHDEHDLIHKAVGWMLREVGNRSLPTEEKFLRKHHRIMPRTMLRYAIEKFPERKRQRYLKGTVKK